MTQRPILLLALTLVGCGAGGGSDDGGTSGNGGGSGTTFCAIVRSERERCASSSGGSDRTTSTVERCEENLDRCPLAPSAFNTTRDPCVTTTTFINSELNAGLKPFPGTCSEYRRWQNGDVECLAAETLSDGKTCRAGRIYCGDTAFPSSLPSTFACDGARLVLQMKRCVAGVITTNNDFVEDCAAGGRVCGPLADSFSCIKPSAGSGGGSASGGTGGGSSSGGSGGGGSGPPPGPP